MVGRELSGICLEESNHLDPWVGISTWTMIGATGSGRKALQSRSSAISGTDADRMTETCRYFFFGSSVHLY
jgi:hypothetical protein